MIPAVEQYLKQATGQDSLNVGKIENSPTIRFSQSILSERKEQIRKQGSYDDIEMKGYFFLQLKICL